ncbi:hypothetical protein [Phaeobacter sp. J2-8]|uniref:hypothetical protein n=1 Tax=Phaeobacter sp. J2-8 TaxID=2931394 RepID=UPI001FD3F5B7|nr:hypothetical protein [Phaeobacter sp. J2-8]MCJ7871624.1 hypothetical protein [Phaeobacter sp. J2-8]
MRYLATGAVILALVLLLFAADFYDQVTNKDSVSDFDTYVVDLQERTSWLTNMSGGSVNGQSNLPRAYLPDAPEGWSRRAWVTEDRKIMPGLAGAEEELLGYSQFYGTNAIGLHTNGLEETLVKQRGTTTWLYENGAKLVEITALKPASFEGLEIQQASMEMAGNNMRALETEAPFVVVQGIVWAKILASSTQTGLEVDWHLSAKVGEIQIYLRALGANETDIRQFLGAIDYDGMNGLLDTPLVAVGSSAPPLSKAEEVTFAKAVLAKRHQAEKINRAQSDLDLEAAAWETLDTLKELSGANVSGLEETRKAWDEKRAELEGQLAAAQKSGAETEVKVNRFGAKQRPAQKGSCGGTSFCSVDKE